MAIKVFNTGKFSEKVIALSTYDSTVLNSLYLNPLNAQKINRGAAILIKNYFDEYMDARAKQSHSSYHHVYEFDNTGSRNSRLFKANINSTPDGSATISYSFIPAKMPNREGYPFPNKAEVMESGNPITITPKKSEYLQFMIEDGKFVKSKQVVVNNPGGSEVAKSFETTFNRFMMSQAYAVLTQSKYYQRIEDAMFVKRKLMIPRINSGLVSEAARRAKMDADEITGGLGAFYA
jgi:hypothetical protein